MSTLEPDETKRHSKTLTERKREQPRLKWLLRMTFRIAYFVNAIYRFAKMLMWTFGG